MRGNEQTELDSFLVERRKAICERMAAAARRAGRSPDEVTMLAVSKTVGPKEVVLAWKAGYRAFGENRPQELKRKLEGIEAYPELRGARFDMIGNLQTNKINQVIGKVSLIHSVSSVHLAQSISKRAAVRGLRCDVLLEVNVSGEKSKAGFSPEELRGAMDQLMGLDGIAVRGLMTMAPAHDADGTRRTFCGLRELAEVLRADTGLGLEVLSSGMSDDFHIAIEEGSTLVRLGRIVFDPGYELR